MPRPRFVVDTSAFLGGLTLPEPASLAVPDSVEAELRPGRDRRRFEAAQAAGLAVHRPGEPARARVREAAARTGDLPRLSAADVDVLALALDLAAPVLSDDYRIQNVGHALGVEVRSSAQKGIRDAWTWVPRCTGCRRVLEAPADVCPVCGSAVKLIRKVQGPGFEPGKR